MTLKQFFQIAGGALISLLFYASKLPPLIKWVFILFFALLGIALAFLPFEDRPLEKWIFSFFRSIYSPTLFFWKDIKGEPVFFSEEAKFPEEKIITPQGKEKMEEYLSKTSSQQLPFLSKLEEKEKTFLSSLGNIFFPGGPVKTQPAMGQQSQPKINVTTPVFQPTLTTPVRPRFVVEEKFLQQQPLQTDVSTDVAPTFKTKGQKVNLGAQFSLEAAPPNPPTVANIIVGQVMDTDGKIVEGAILEVKDSIGRPVRALKSNKLGHFMVVTPLQNGRYEIFTEKEGLIFEPVFFDAKGEIIPPIAIKGKNQINPVVTELKNSQAGLKN